MTTLCKTIVPKFILEDLEPIKDDDVAVKNYGIDLACEMCRTLRTQNINGFHFYTLNLERAVELILEKLEFVAPISDTRPLPWCPVSVCLTKIDVTQHDVLVSVEEAGNRNGATHFLEE
jgi:methylenetetrahydrofolate reductase (NADPH)